MGRSRTLGVQEGPALRGFPDLNVNTEKTKGWGMETVQKLRCLMGGTLQDRGTGAGRGGTIACNVWKVQRANFSLGVLYNQNQGNQEGGSLPSPGIMVGPAGTP